MTSFVLLCLLWFKCYGFKDSNPKVGDILCLVLNCFKGLKLYLKLVCGQQFLCSIVMKVFACLHVDNKVLMENVAQTTVEGGQVCVPL